MTVVNNEFPAEKQEGELTPDELKVVSGGFGMSAFMWVGTPTPKDPCPDTDPHIQIATCDQP